MESIIKQQPSTSVDFDGNQKTIETKVMNNEKVNSSRQNFPHGLRGGGACFDCLACLCFCCAIEEIGCFECCKDC